MKLRAYLAAIFLLASLPIVAAGEVASFINLGFSEDSQSFMFGVYGVEEKTSFPWAEAFVVNVEKNRFVENGQRKIVGEKSIGIGQDGNGALYNLIGAMNPVVAANKIDHTNMGRMIYILLNGASEQEKITFRDFNLQNTFEINILQSQRMAQGSTDQQEAAFSLSMKVSGKDGTSKVIQIGKANYFRKDVNKYLLRQVILSPDEKSLVFVIEKISSQKNGFSTSFMVETARIF